MDGDAGWVLYAEQAGHVARAVRKVRHAGVDRVVPLRDGAACAELSDPPSEALRRRVARVLGHPVEERLNCDVAHYPLGRGTVVWLIDQPADGLDALLERERPVYRDLVRPSSLEEPFRLCLPALSVADPARVGEVLREAGFHVRATYEVGGCRR